MAGSERSPASWVDAFHEVEEILINDAVEPESSGAAAAPPSGRLAPVEVVAKLVLDVVAAGVGASEGGSAGSHGRFPHGCVHSSVGWCDGWASERWFMGCLWVRRRSSGTTEIPELSR